MEFTEYYVLGNSFGDNNFTGLIPQFDDFTKINISSNGGVPLSCNYTFKTFTSTDKLINIDLKNNYDNGYNTGYTAGDNDGYTRGYDTGYAIGYDIGYNAGYDIGYTAGDVAGNATGYDIGYTAGESKGLIDGYNQGKIHGYNTGISVGQTNAYDNGVAAGHIAGYTEGISAGEDFADTGLGPVAGVTNGLLQTTILAFDTIGSKNFLGVPIWSFIIILVTIPIIMTIIGIIKKFIK